jgi:hypothetical protein
LQENADLGTRMLTYFFYRALLTETRLAAVMLPMHRLYDVHMLFTNGVSLGDDSVNTFNAAVRAFRDYYASSTSTSKNLFWFRNADNFIGYEKELGFDFNPPRHTVGALIFEQGGVKVPQVLYSHVAKILRLVDAMDNLSVS